jgi:hypothetical protein
MRRGLVATVAAALRAVAAAPAAAATGDGLAVSEATTSG